MSDEGTEADLLEERPYLKAPLEAVLDVDQRNDTWTFDDLPIDSGPFGELVSRDVVESVGDEYRLADPDAVAGALDGDGKPSAPANADLLDGSLPTLPSIDRTTAAFVTLAVGFVALVRLHPVASIYRNGDVVLSGNTPTPIATESNRSPTPAELPT